MWRKIQNKPSVLEGIDNSTSAASLRTNLGLGAYATILNNLSATSAPTVNDDSGDGYSVGSIWVNLTTDKVYILTDSTVGAANWADLSLLSTPAGSDTEVQYNNAGAFGASANFKWVSSTTIQLTGAAASTILLKTLVTGDSDYRYKVKSDGTLEWGDGENPVDVTLSRSSSGVLTITGNLNVSGLTSTRVIFASTSGRLADSSNFTYTTGTGQLTLATTGSGAGLLVGGDAQWFRGAADRWETPDELYLSTLTMGIGTAPVSTQGIKLAKTWTASDVTGIGVTTTRNETSGSTANRCIGLAFSAITGGTQAFSSVFAATGMEGFGTHSGSGQSEGAVGGSFGTSVTSSGDLVRATGVLVNAPTRGSTGHITNTRMIDIAAPNALTANSQTRIGIRFAAMPTAGAFTGTTIAAIQFNSATGLAIDGLLWRGNTNLYASADDTLKTDDHIDAALSIKAGRRITSGVIALTDGANIATDAALGNYGRVTLAGNRTLDNPTNGLDGQKFTWEFIQDGTGSRTITLGSKFAFGTDITGVTLTTTASKRDFMTAIYNSTADKWYVVGFTKGY